MGCARLLLLATLSSFASCRTGRIYTHTREPLDVNFNRTPVFSAANESGTANVKHIKIPFTTVDLDFLWSSNAIGDIAARDGIEQVYYADQETFSILGIWNQYAVHVYGRPAPPGAAAAATR